MGESALMDVTLFLNEFVQNGFDFHSASGICSFVFGLLVFIAIDFFIIRFVRRVFFWIAVIVFEALLTVGYAFGMFYLASASGIVLASTIIVVLLNYQNEYRAFMEIPERKVLAFLFRRRKRPSGPEYIFDREKMYQEIYRAVIDMSHAKRGALITFIKKDNLLDDSKIGNIVKQRGIDVNAPVSAELLETIFYEGTRLHDGAVIIKDDKIARAAVFFRSTNKALTGKYGSRHQAAIGISENSDSVTIVISEETGRINIAFQGELTSVSPDNFMRVFEGDMAYLPEEPLDDKE